MDPFFDKGRRFPGLLLLRFLLRDASSDELSSRFFRRRLLLRLSGTSEESLFLLRFMGASEESSGLLRRRDMGRLGVRFPPTGDDKSAWFDCRFPLISHDGAAVFSTFGLFVGTGMAVTMGVMDGRSDTRVGALVGTDAATGAEVVLPTGLCVESTGAALGTETGAGVLSATGMTVDVAGAGVAAAIGLAVVVTGAGVLSATGLAVVVAGAGVAAAIGLTVVLTGAPVASGDATGANVATGLKDGSAGTRTGASTGASVLATVGTIVVTSLGIELTSGHKSGSTGGSCSSV